MLVICDHAGESPECFYGCEHKDPHVKHFDGCCDNTTLCGEFRVKCMDVKYAIPKEEPVIIYD